MVQHSRGSMLKCKMKNKISLISVIIFCVVTGLEAQVPAINPDPNFPYQSMPKVLAATKELEPGGDRSQKMLDGAHTLIEEKINGSIINRSKYWHRDFSSAKAYELSVEPNRKRFMNYIGVEDKTEPPVNFNVGLEDKNPAVYLEKISVDDTSVLVGETTKYRIYQVRWPALNRVYGEGLLLQPKGKAVANIIALPDADQTPEQLVGLSPGVAPKSQFARRLKFLLYQ